MPSTGVAFLSRDPAIAEVSGSGVVTAGAPGVAVIRATLTLRRDHPDRRHGGDGSWGLPGHGRDL